MKRKALICGSDSKEYTYITTTDMVLGTSTDHVYRVTALERYETEAFLDVLLAIKRLLDQINLQK